MSFDNESIGYYSLLLGVFIIYILIPLQVLFVFLRIIYIIIKKYKQDE